MSDYPDEIILTVEPEVVKEEVVTAEASAAKYMENIELTPAEQKAVDAFLEQIDLTNSNLVLQYGASAQKKIADFSDNALQGVKTKDLGEVSDMITGLVTQLKGFSMTEEKKGLFGRIKKIPTPLAKLRASYENAEVNIDQISGSLENYRNQLGKDVVMLDKLYDSNKQYFRELSMYIIAGKKKLEQERSTTLVELKKKAEESGLAEDAQAANDYAALCDRFEKKVHDLELTRAVSVQMAPQIRLIQNSDVLMSEKIQSTISNTIPLWKNQMVLALGMEHVKQATDAQHQVSELTNALLKQNAESLKQGTIAVAEEGERSIIDIETVQETNQKLIETFDEVLRIQEEGRNKRIEAENELGRIETELKQKLLDIRG